MSNVRNRRYARTYKKKTDPQTETDNSELSLSSSAALGILGGTFLLGLVSGKIISLCRR